MKTLNVSDITDEEVKRFLTLFLKDREVNKEVYRRIPEDKFDFHMVDTPDRQSDSPRKSLIHQIYVTRNHVNSIKTGMLQWGDKIYDQLMKGDFQSKSKAELLSLLEQTEQQLVNALKDPSLGSKTIKVDWNPTPVPALTSLLSLDRHEILHQGWNLAIMDYLNIPRFPKLREMWG